MNIKTILTNYWESIKSYLVTNYQPKGTYSDSGHTHDDRYYTETETDVLLSTKSNTDHLHDSRYYTETEIDDKLSGKSDTTHNHDNTYLGINANAVSATKATNNASGKELVNTIVKNISISGTTITVTKLDGSTYTLTTQDTNTTYSKLSQFTNDSGYITSSGSCNYANSAGAVAWGNVSGKPSSYTPSSHTHDDRYYTESEVNNLLSGKSNTNHTHSYISTSASCNKNWNWSGQGGQPTWLWGGEDGTNMYVYNPSNFSVNYANSAGSATYASRSANNGGFYISGYLVTIE